MTRIGVLVVTLAALLVPTAPAGAAPVGQFRELAEVGTGLVDLASDGERFAWVQTRPRVPSLGSIRIYDTLRARDFELVAPNAGCGFAGIAGGRSVGGLPRTGIPAVHGSRDGADA